MGLEGRETDDGGGDGERSEGKCDPEAGRRAEKALDEEHDGNGVHCVNALVL